MSFVNGFGAHEQLKHQIIPGASGSERDLSSSSLLQVLVRYCKAESPYIAAFVAHYQALFADCHFIFAVQNKNDAKSLEEALRASTALFQCIFLEITPIAICAFLIYGADFA